MNAFYEYREHIFALDVGALKVRQVRIGQGFGADRE
jgi:hypothetical protein